MVQRVFQLYIQKHEETYGKHPQLQMTLFNFKKFDSLKETGEHFSINNIISEEDQQQIKQTLNISAALTWQDVTKYAVNFTFKDISISQHPLVQKKFKIMRDVGSVTKSFRECWMVATVDDMLLFYDEMDVKEAEKRSKGIALTDGGHKINNQAKKKFILDCIQIKSKDDSLVEIIEKTKGLIFDSTQKQLIKFIRADDFEEFKVFMIRYQSSPNAKLGGIEQSESATDLTSEKKK